MPDRGGDDEWLGELDWGAPEPGRGPRPQPEARQTEILHAERPEISRRRAVAVVAGLVLLGAAIGGPLTAFRGSPAKTPAAATTTATTTTRPVTTTTQATTTTAAPASVELPASGTMRRGETDSAKVRALQAALIALGYTAVKEDGVFGAGTQAAVVAFQRAHTLPDDGIVGRSTADAINAAVAAQSG